jgi:hypothetical protein
VKIDRGFGPLVPHVVRMEVPGPDGVVPPLTPNQHRRFNTAIPAVPLIANSCH